MGGGGWAMFGVVGGLMGDLLLSVDFCGRIVGSVWKINCMFEVENCYTIVSQSFA